MKEISVWNSNLAKKLKYYADIENLLKQENITAFQIKDAYREGDETSCIYDELASLQNISLIYTDEYHPLCVLPQDVIYINSIYFEKNKDKIKNNFRKKLLESEDDLLVINKDIFSDEFLEDLIQSNKQATLYFMEGISLKPEQIKKLQDHFIEASIKQGKDWTHISSKYALGLNSLETIKKKKDIKLILDTPWHLQVQNLKYLQPDAILTITYFIPDDLEKENEIYNRVEELLSLLDSQGQKLNIQFSIQHRELFIKSSLYQKNYSNLNINLQIETETYSLSEFQKQEATLNAMIDTYVNPKMSSYEKYMAIYNCVKNYKTYKENEENKMEARSLKYLLENEYMVCVGYGNLLMALLDKIGIENISYSQSVEVSKPDADVIEVGGHARVIVHLDDPKYGIKGYYVSDPTWDNNLGKELLVHSAMTFPETETGRRLLKLNEHGLLLGAHSLEDFDKRVDYWKHGQEKKSISYTINSFELSLPKEQRSELNMIQESFYDYYMNLLYSLNKHQYHEFYMKYQKMKTKKLFEEFYQDIRNHIVEMNQCPISGKTMIEATIATKLLQAGADQIMNLDWKESMIKDNQNYYKFSFPYQIASQRDILLEDNPKNKFEDEETSKTL